MKASEVYPPSLLNVRTMNEMGLWDKQYTIQNVERVEFERDGRHQVKLALHLLTQNGTPLPARLGLNVTNKNRLVQSYGDETDYWKGKAIRLVRVRVLFRGQMTDSIGVEPL